MKKLIGFVFFFIGINHAFSQTKFDVKFSELYATYDFITKISNNYPENIYKTEFLKSKYYTDDLNNEITQFVNLSIDYSYVFNQYPSFLKSGVMSRSLIERNLVTSKSIAEFENKTLGIIPNEDLTKFSNSLRTFLPIYNQLIFEPNKEKFELQKSGIEKYINNQSFGSFFEKGLAFYGAAWDTNQAFEIVLVPGLEKNHLNARAFLNVAICEPPLDLKDYNVLFSVTMHEIYHIIYDNQALSLKNNLKEWFRNTNSINSQYALLLLNEVLSTDLGNAYVMETLNQKIDDDDWYDDFYITQMAKELYPTVKTYLEAGKTIDENFIKEYVKIYDTKFPHWNKELNHLLAYRYILTDDENDFKFFRGHFRKYSYHRSGLSINVTEIEKLKEQPFTKVIIISKNNKTSLSLVKEQFKELSDKKFDDRKEFILSVHLLDNTRLILINRIKSTTEDLIKTNLLNNQLP